MTNIQDCFLRISVWLWITRTIVTEDGNVAYKQHVLWAYLHRMSWDSGSSEGQGQNGGAGQDLEQETALAGTLFISRRVSNRHKDTQRQTPNFQKLDKDFIDNWITYLFYTYFINDTWILHFLFFLPTLQHQMSREKNKNS